MIGLKFGVSPTTVQNVLDLFKVSGQNAFAEKTKNKTYAPQLKEEIVLKALAGESMHSLALAYGATGSLIKTWVTKYNVLGFNGLVNSKRGAKPVAKQKLKLKKVKKGDSKEVKRLKEELNKAMEEKSRAEIENEILKKQYP